MKAQTKIIIGAATIAATLLVIRKVNNAPFEREWEVYKAAEKEEEARIENEIKEQTEDLLGDLPDVNFII